MVGLMVGLRDLGQVLMVGPMVGLRDLGQVLMVSKRTFPHQTR